MNEISLKRFWNKVDKIDGCWNWTASIKKGRHHVLSQEDRSKVIQGIPKSAELQTKEDIMYVKEQMLRDLNCGRIYKKY